jgi:uncharacterized membrane protein
MASLRFASPKSNVNLWIVPLRMSLAAVLLFAITMVPDMLAAYHVIHIPDWFSMGGIDDARAILSSMMGCVSTVLALIFSVALLVLSMVANLFGPRLLYRFVQDWVTQTCIGIFMGAFIYVFLVFLVTHQDQHSTFIPQVSLITSWFLVLGAFAFLVFYSHRVAELIQNPDAIGRIVDDLRRAADIVCKEDRGEPGRHLAAADDASADRSQDGAEVLSRRSGYLQTIDHRRLVRVASEAGACIRMAFRPGQFVLEGEVLAVVSPAGAQPGLTPQVQDGVDLGRHRVLSQDLEFGIAQIVEIAIRALSPAVNDTFTGVASVDLLGEALAILAGTRQIGGNWYGPDGELRLQVPALLLPRLVKQSFDQIRQAAADNPAVLIRLLSTLGRLSSRVRTAEDRSALLQQAAAVWETANSRPPVTMDREDIEAAWRKCSQALAEV